MSISLALAVALFVGVLHVYIFCLESLWWGSDKSNKIFRVRLENVETLRLWAFNQGFYNLFLSLGIFAGCGLIYLGRAPQGSAVVDFAMASIFFAGLVLSFSSKKWKAGVIQSGPALVYFFLRVIGF